jgi:rubredoxin
MPIIIAGRSSGSTPPKQPDRITPIGEDEQMKTYLCVVCGFVYDEASGRAEDGIAPGTRWADIPGDWSCPECGVAKADFEVVEI